MGKQYYNEEYGRLTIIDTRELLTREKALCRCSCGNEKYITISKIIGGETKSCGCLRNDNSKKSDKRVINLTGKKFGRLTVLSLLPKECNHARKWRCLCSCGNYTDVDSYSLTSGRTKSCGCLVKELKPPHVDLTGKKFGAWTVEREDGRNSHNSVMWFCICRCGNTGRVSYSSLISGKSKGCGCARRGKPNLKARVDISGKRYGRLTVLYLLNPESCDSTKIWRCRCDCGNISDVPYSSLTCGHSTSCGCLFKEQLSKRSVKDISGLRFGMLTVIERYGTKDRKATWRCKCDCGNDYIAVGKQLRCGEVLSCGCVLSKAESSCADILRTNDVAFTKQKRFDDCRDKLALPFDVYIDDLNICIELDGIQHYEPRSGFGNGKYFQKTQLHDKIKDEYCANKNIKLIRIPYTEFNRIEEILIENSIIKGETNGKTALS